MYNGIFDFYHPDKLDKKIALLEAIDKEGSISKAAKTVPMSYKIAWEMIDEMNNISKEPIVVKSVGGSGGGGTKLTCFGRKLIEDYKNINSEYKRFVKAISHIEDINSIRKLALKISARNQLFGKIIEIKKDCASAQISFKLKSGIVLRSSITLDAAKELELDIGNDIVGIIKASSILIGDKQEFKKKVNLFEGTIEKLELGEVNANIKVDINRLDKMWITCKKSLLDKFDLENGCKVYIFIRPKDIMIGI